MSSNKPPKKSTTVLMEKVNLDNGVFVYRPVKVIRGTYDDKQNMFFDEYEGSYYNISDAIMMGYDSEETYGFTMHYSDNDLRAHFPAASLGESMSYLMDKIRDFIWVGVPQDDEQKVQLVQVSVDSFFSTVQETNEPIKELTEEDVLFSVVLTEQEMAELLTIDDIKILKDALIKYNERYIEGKNKVLQDLGLGISEETDEKIEDTQKVKSKVTSKKTVKKEPIYKKVNVEELYKYITERVIGQDEAVREIITVFLMNRVGVDMGILEEEELTRMLITGPTGCGKTMILDTMLEYLSKVHDLHFPIAKIPTSQLTAAGYVGMNLEDILDTLMYNAKGEFYDQNDKIRWVERNGIVFLDEIDKKGSRDNGDVSGRGVLNALLEFMSGADYEIGKGAYVHKFNTKYLTIIASGSFANVYDDKSTRSIGFGFNANEPVKKKIKPEDFIEKGQMPGELMGRFHKIIPLEPLTQDTLGKIVTDSKKSTLIATRKKLATMGVDLKWDESYIKKVAEEAHKLKTGGRSLKSIIETSLFEIQWEALKRQEPMNVIVTAETVEDPKKIMMLERKKRGKNKQTH